MFLGSQHEDTEDELRGQEHLDEEASDNGSLWTQSRLYCKGSRK